MFVGLYNPGLYDSTNLDLSSDKSGDDEESFCGSYFSGDEESETLERAKSATAIKPKQSKAMPKKFKTKKNVENGMAKKSTARTLSLSQPRTSMASTVHRESMKR